LVLNDKTRGVLTKVSTNKLRIRRVVETAGMHANELENCLLLESLHRPQKKVNIVDCNYMELVTNSQLAIFIKYSAGNTVNLFIL